MESGFLGSVQSLIDAGVLAESSLFFIIITILVYGYTGVLKPIKKKTDNILTVLELERLIEKEVEREQKELRDIRASIDSLVVKLGRFNEIIEDSNKTGTFNSMEIENIRRDVSSIKQILNQFQGHMMYGGRRSSDFGNRELD